MSTPETTSSATKQRFESAPQDGGASQTDFITSLNPNDVLCGRGSGPNDHSGNIRFRQLVLSRKAEYLSTNARQTKARIAQEIVDYVQNNVDPPGRFLKKLEAGASKEAGFAQGVDVWSIVTEDIALEKAKQALRQNRDRHLVEAQIQQRVQEKINRAGGHPPSVASSGASDKTPLSSSTGSHPSATPPPPPQENPFGRDSYFPPGNPMHCPQTSQHQQQAPPVSSYHVDGNPYKIDNPEMGPPTQHHTPGITNSLAMNLPSTHHPPGVIRQTSKNRESITVADLEKDFQRMHAERNHLRFMREQDGQAQQEHYQYQQQHHQKPQDRGLSPVKFSGLGENEGNFQEQFPYALGGRGPSAQNDMNRIDPLPLNQRDASPRVSDKTMQFMQTAFGDVSPQQGDQQTQDQNQRQRQFLEQQAKKATDVAESPDGVSRRIEYPNPSIISIRSENRRSSNISALTGMSDMSLSMSLSEFGFPKVGPPGPVGMRPQSIKEGKREDLSDADLEGSSSQQNIEGLGIEEAPAQKAERESSEPRRISSIRGNPDAFSLGNSSMSIMKGFSNPGLEDVSVFSGMSMLTNGSDEESRMSLSLSSKSKKS